MGGGLASGWAVLCGVGVLPHEGVAGGERRAFLRFFAGEEDLSHEGMDSLLPDAVARGEEALLIVGAVAGG